MMINNDLHTSTGSVWHNDCFSFYGLGCETWTLMPLTPQSYPLKQMRILTTWKVAIQVNFMNFCIDFRTFSDHFRDAFGSCLDCFDGWFSDNFAPFSWHSFVSSMSWCRRRRRRLRDCRFRHGHCFSRGELPRLCGASRCGYSCLFWPTCGLFKFHARRGMTH